LRNSVCSTYGTEGPAWTDVRIAEAVEASPKTVFNVRKKWVELGIDKVLERRPQKRPSRLPKLDGRAEAKIIAISCEPAPEGRARWTLRLLADKTVELGFADSISPETIRQTLKKRRQAVAARIMVPAEETRCRIRVANGRRSGRLCAAGRPRFPVICMGEAPKQLVGEVRDPLPPRPGDVEKNDSEYVRNGTHPPHPQPTKIHTHNNLQTQSARNTSRGSKF